MSVTITKKPYLEKLKEHAIQIMRKNSAEQDKPTLTTHQESVFNTINKEQFGCQNPHAVKFVSAFMEIDFVQRMNIKGNFNGMIVVAIGDTSHHGYPQNTPLCIITGRTAFIPEKNTYGSKGFPIPFESESRPATEEEINAFYDFMEKYPDTFLTFSTLMNSHSGVRD